MTATATATATATNPPAAGGAPPNIIQSFRAVLKKAVELGASDVHICAGGPFRIRLRGQVMPLTGVPPLEPGDISAIAATILVNAKKATPDTVETLLRDLRDIDCSYSLPGTGRFRVNLCSQRGSISAVLRNIPLAVPDVAELGLPAVVRDLAGEDRGLILVTGVTGSGKSTTLAAMLSVVTKTRAAKVGTIEDPIEFLHNDDRSVVIQRELGCDTDSFSRAL